MTAVTQTQSTARSIAFYAGVWVVVLAVGAVGLMLLRQWGWKQIEHAHVRDSFAQAWQFYENGDVVQAQKNVTTLLAARPARLADAMEQFDTVLLGLPAAVRGAKQPEAARSLPPIDRARHAVIFQGGKSAAANESPTAALWQARQQVLQGRFDEARKGIQVFWAANHSQRPDVVASLWPKPSEMKAKGGQAADQLFWAGLWPAAVDVAKQARAAGADDPSLLFFEALGAETAEGKEAALVKYRACLEAIPNHELALRRLMVLEDE